MALKFETSQTGEHTASFWGVEIARKSGGDPDAFVAETVRKMSERGAFRELAVADVVRAVYPDLWRALKSTKADCPVEGEGFSLDVEQVEAIFGVDAGYVERWCLYGPKAKVVSGILSVYGIWHDVEDEFVTWDVVGSTPLAQPVEPDWDRYYE